MARHPHRFLDVHPSSATAVANANGHACPTSTPSPSAAFFAAAAPPPPSPPPPPLLPPGKQSSLGAYISPLRLSPATAAGRDESTRVQLQRQRLTDFHANALVSRNIPGFKTSAAFFASLRTNLRLNTSPPPSPMSTPPSMRGSAASLPPPSPLAAPADSVDSPVDGAASPSSEDPLAGVPELHSYRADDDHDKIAALRLVADSMAQMRQTANNTLISHPLNLAAFVAVAAVAARFLHASGRDPIMVALALAGLTMIAFASCRFFTQQYLYAAEELTWAWLADADVLVTKFGDEIIGTLVVDWPSAEPRQKRKKACRGEIRAWTVRLKYRNKGVGVALLEDAVKEAKARGAETIEFAPDHANALRLLPAIYNKPFDRRERKAKELLQDLFEASPGRGKRK